MKLCKWPWNWFAGRRRKQVPGAREKIDPREFVYLDETSVYSLLAWIKGAIAEKVTETSKATSERRLGLSGSLGTVGGAGLDLAKAHAEGFQVVRRALIQTTFRELHTELKDSFTIGPIMGDHKAPPKDFDNLDAIANQRDFWIIDPAVISRGQVLEMEIELEAEAVFRFRTAVSSIHEIVQVEPELFGLDRRSEIMVMGAVDKVLQKLLGGLVPVRGRAVDYKVVEIEGRELIVHRKLLNLLSRKVSLKKYPLFVVGVAEESLFWKDVRRVLFSNARFRVLCRVSQNGVQESWEPVKLVQVLKSVEPGIAREIKSLSDGVFAPMGKDSSNSGMGEEDPQINRVQLTLVAYAALLARYYNKSLGKEQLSEVERLAGRYSELKGIDQRRKAFNCIADYICNEFDLEKEPLVIARLRECASRYHNDDRASHEGAGSGSGIDPSSDTVSAGERFLDTELVAIYW